MAKIVAYDDVSAGKTKPEVTVGGHAWRTEFRKPPSNNRVDAHIFVAQRFSNIAEQ